MARDGSFARPLCRKVGDERSARRLRSFGTAFHRLPTSSKGPASGKAAPCRWELVPSMGTAAAETRSAVISPGRVDDHQAEGSRHHLAGRELHSGGSHGNVNQQTLALNEGFFIEK